MNKKILYFCVLLFVLPVLFGLSGCEKDEPVDIGRSPEKDIPKAPAAESSSDVKDTDPKPEALDAMMKDLDPETAKKVSAMLADAKKDSPVQTICPVMEGPTKKDIFVEYQGKKVYFCCESCKSDFNADPGKYLSKLPQFKK